MNKFPSIFNDALAPVTPGPSSSNTCGPSRIARVCRQIFGRKPAKLTVELSTKGRLILSYLGMRTDLAFLNGTLGRSCTHERFINAREDALAEGITMESFFRDDLPGFPTHMAVLTLEDKDGYKMTFHTTSLGGGAFSINAIDGCPVSIEGDNEELLLFADPIGEAEKEAFLKQADSIPGLNSATCCPGSDFCIFDIKTDTPVTDAAAEDLASAQWVRFWRKAAPEHDVVMSAARRPPFDTPTSFMEYAEKNSIPLWQAAVDYEAAISGWTKERVLEVAAQRWEIIEVSIQGGFTPGNDMNGIVPALAPAVKEAFTSGKLIPMGAADEGCPVALSIMEYSNCSGVITCIPTGGSSGVVPGALYGAAKAIGKSKEDIIKALLVSGLIGTFMESTKYLGALGCQAEIGCAAGMAAAGLISLMNGTAAQACCAAVMAIQSLSGLICDKIAGLVQVPCLSRNMTAVSIAMVAANATMAGMESLVPMDETIDYMLKTGAMLRDHGINNMGACATATGKRLNSEQKARNRR